MPPVQYVLVRKDMPIYIQMVQVAHAAGEAIRSAPIPKDTIVRLLHVADEQELRAYHDKLASKGIPVALVLEPDEPFNGAATALATEPMTGRVNAVGKVLWHLRRAED